MTTEELIAKLREADPSGKGEVLIYEDDGRVEGWSDIKTVDQAGPPRNEDADADVIIEVGDCVAANSSHRGDCGSQSEHGPGSVIDGVFDHFAEQPYDPEPDENGPAYGKD